MKPSKSAMTTDAAPLEPKQGLRFDADDEATLRKAIDLAMDYRGDVTITRASDGAIIEGYLFDRADNGDFGQSSVKVLCRDDSERVTIPYSDITALEFSGRDTAEGKSFETWMKKYVQKKLAGQEASIHSEPLESDATQSSDSVP